jgi:hypothetical protein
MKKKSITTKPLYITQAGTLYHIINTIIQKKECYMENTNSHDKEDQDTSNMKRQAIQTEPMANLTLNLFKGACSSLMQWALHPISLKTTTNNACNHQ